MTDTPMKIVVNCETGVTEEIPLTSAEIAELEASRIQAEAEAAARLAEETAKAEAKASALAKLEALGLSTEEIAAITA